MEFKPNEFFLGLVDFITILLPGALLTGVLLAVDNSHSGWYATNANKIGPLYCFGLDDGTSVIFWTGFAFTSFGLGYFLSSIASGLDVLSDNIRKELFPYKKLLFKQFLEQEKNKEIGDNYEDPKLEIEDGKELLVVNNGTGTIKIRKSEFDNFCKDFLSNGFRRFFHFLFELKSEVSIDKSLEVVLSLKNSTLGKGESTINAYKWNLLLLETHCPVAAEQINRTMAASKFFRSLVVVFILLLLFLCFGVLPKSDSSLSIVSILSIFSFREYIVQRQKSIEMAYKGLITLYFLPARFVKTKD